jgi:hypothetical protein
MFAVQYKEIWAGGDDAHRALPDLVPDNFTGNASYRRDNLAPLKVSKPYSAP